MPSSAPLVESPLHDFKDTLRLMKIARIWFSGVRTLNTPTGHASANRAWTDQQPFEVGADASAKGMP